MAEIPTTRKYPNYLWLFIFNLSVGLFFSLDSCFFEYAYRLGLFYTGQESLYRLISNLKKKKTKCFVGPTSYLHIYIQVPPIKLYLLMLTVRPSLRLIVHVSCPCHCQYWCCKFKLCSDFVCDLITKLSGI